MPARTRLVLSLLLSAALTVLVLSRTSYRGAPAALLGCALPLSPLVAAVIGLLTR